MDLLLADDDQFIRQVLEKQVEGFGYHVHTVNNGVDALECFMGKTTPKIAILDWMMPGLSGIDLCKKIRKAPLEFQPYIIIVTARNHAEDIALAIDSGADDYIQKPFTRIEIKARLSIGKRYIEAREQIKVLHGLLPICSVCKKIRNDKDYWQNIEDYLCEHADVKFSHALCHDCMRKEFPELIDHMNEHK